MTTQTLNDRQALALQSGPFRDMDEDSARRLNYALYGALVKLESVDSGEVEGTFMGISFGKERAPSDHAIWDGDIAIMTTPGHYLSINCRNVLSFQILQAVRYNCAFCGQWESPDNLVQDEFAPNRLIHKRDCQSRR